MERMTSCVRIAVKTLLWVLMITSFCGAQDTGPSGFCSTQGRWLLDGQGRVILLHSINTVCKDKAERYLSLKSKDEAIRIREWGFNSVRYGIIWDGVEPAPGQYDDVYLDQVAERMDWLREAGVRVILDMHQDLYAKKYGSPGAPEWACLDDGIPFVPATGGGWFMNYPTPAVMRSFDNFWANKPGPGGVGIQDRYVAAWQHIARRFKDDTNIIGYDVMNEPFYGSNVIGVVLAAVWAVQKEVESGTFASKPSIAGADPADVFKQTVMTLIEKDRIFEVMDRASWPAQRFEAMSLQPFYDKMAAGIRSVDPNHIFVFEPAGGSSSGTHLRTAIQAPKDAQGKPLGNSMFSPHHYEFATDMAFVYDPNTKTVTRSLNRAASSADAMGVPTWFGEWGAWTGLNLGTEALILEHLDTFDELLCGWSYWAYGSDFGNFPLLPALGRAYAEVVAGVPTRMKSGTNALELSFTPSASGGETLLWVPAKTEISVSWEPAGAAGWAWERDPSGRVHLTHPAGAQASIIRVTF